MFIYSEMRSGAIWDIMENLSKIKKITTKAHQMPIEKLCTKFGAFVRPTGFNIMLKI